MKQLTIEAVDKGYRSFLFLITAWVLSKRDSFLVTGFPDGQGASGVICFNSSTFEFSVKTSITDLCSGDVVVGVQTIDLRSLRDTALAIAMDEFGLESEEGLSEQAVSEVLEELYTPEVIYFWFYESDLRPVFEQILERLDFEQSISLVDKLGEAFRLLKEDGSAEDSVYQVICEAVANNVEARGQETCIYGLN